MSTSPRKDTVLLRSCVRAEFLLGEALATVLRVCTPALAGGSKPVTGGVWGACRSGKERTGSDGSTRAGDWPAQAVAVAVTNTGEGSAGAAPGRPDTAPPSTSPRPPDKPPLCGAEPRRLLAKLVTLNGVVSPDAPLVLLLLLLTREESATTLWKFPDGLSGGNADEFVTLAPIASVPFLSLFARLVLLGATLLMKLLMLQLLVVVLEAVLPLLRVLL